MNTCKNIFLYYHISDIIIQAENATNNTWCSVCVEDVTSFIHLLSTFDGRRLTLNISESESSLYWFITAPTSDLWKLLPLALGHSLRVWEDSYVVRDTSSGEFLTARIPKLNLDCHRTCSGRNNSKICTQKILTVNILVVGFWFRRSLYVLSTMYVWTEREREYQAKPHLTVRKPSYIIIGCGWAFDWLYKRTNCWCCIRNRSFCMFRSKICSFLVQYRLDMTTILRFPWPIPSFCSRLMVQLHVYLTVWRVYILSNAMKHFWEWIWIQVITFSFLLNLL